MELKRGDRIVFYAARNGGRDAMHFLACGEVAGPRVESRREDPDRPRWMGLLGSQLFDIPISGAQWFETPVPARPLVKRLTFVRNPDAWGSYFQGGVRKISGDDYDTIVEAAQVASA